MIKHIECHTHNALNDRSIKLNNLGQLNVLVGKNGSGKSTILEAVNSSMFDEGFDFDSELTGIIINKLNDVLNSGLSSLTRLAISEFLNIIKEYEGQVVFFEKLSDFSIPINNRIQVAIKNSGDKSKLGDNYTLDILRKHIIKNDGGKLLIPPKRKFEPNKVIFLNDSINITNGLVPFLFDLKNQPLDSDQFSKYKKISNSFKKVANASFHITLTGDKLNLQFRTHKNWLNAEDCGLGYYDILVILTHVLSTNAELILIEEPENHLHPDFQKRLLNFFKDQNDKQIILSTHSEIFTDTNIVDQLFLCSLESNRIKVVNGTSQSKVLNELGYSTIEKVASDAIVLTEGPTDIAVLNILMNWIGLSDHYKIKLWPLGGDLMASDYLDLTIFGEPSKVYTLIDKDNKSKKARDKFKSKAAEENIFVHQLERYAIENYFSMEAIKKTVPGVKLLNKLDHSIELEKQIEENIKGRNSLIVENMTLEDFKGADLLGFLEKIKEDLDKRKAEQDNS